MHKQGIFAFVWITTLRFSTFLCRQVQLQLLVVGQSTHQLVSLLTLYAISGWCLNALYFHAHLKWQATISPAWDEHFQADRSILPARRALRMEVFEFDFPISRSVKSGPRLCRILVSRHSPLTHSHAGWKRCFFTYQLHVSAVLLIWNASIRPYFGTGGYLRHFSNIWLTI